MPKQHFEFRNPVMNAAGSLGFSPSANMPITGETLGAFITNPISYKSRKTANTAGLEPYPGGILLHNGHPNPGIKSVLKRHQGRWQRASLPVIVHLLGGPPEEMAHCVRLLEELENVMGVELGLPDDVSAAEAAEITAAAVGELPLMVRLPLTSAVALAPVVSEAGASAISLAPPRGALTSETGNLQYGRLYGPAVFPLALQTVGALAQLPLDVVGAGGIYQPRQVQAMLAAGAIAVQLDTVLWRGEWQAQPDQQSTAP